MSNLRSEDEETTASLVFQRLEREFQDVIKELEEDDHLEKFKDEYEKIFDTLQKSIQNEKRLYNKCVELNREILSNSTRVEALLQLTQRDQEVIKQLGDEIENGWQMVESSTGKYQKSISTIESLQTTILDLKREIERTKKQRLGRDKEIKSLILRKEAYKSKLMDHIREKKGLQEEQSKFERDLFHLEQQQIELEDKLKKLDEEKSHTLRSLDHLETNLNTARQALDKAAKKEKEVYAKLRELSKRTKKENHYVKQKKNEIDVQTQSVASSQVERENLDTQITLIKDQISTNREKCAKTRKQTSELLEQLRNRKTLRRETYNAMEMEKKKLTRLLLDARKIEQKHQTLTDFRDGWEGKIQKVDEESTKVNQLRRKEQKSIRHQVYETKKLKYRVVVSRQKEGEKVVDKTKMGIINHSLKEKIEDVESAVQAQEKTLREVERDREKYAREASQAQKNFKEAVEKVKIGKLQNDDLSKKIIENQERLKDQQNRYEQVRIDRNTYSRQLVESNEEIAFMKRKFDIMAQQLNQLSEEISTSIRGLHKVEAAKRREIEDKKKKMVDLSKAMREVKILEEKKKKVDQEKERLNTIIDEMDKVRKEKRAKLQQVTYDRDLIGTQLIRRNDELALLSEKVKIQERTFRNGNIKFLQLQGEIRMLKLRVKELQREIVLLRSKLGKTVKSKRKIKGLKVKVVEEKKKVKALGEALEDPTRIERWRRLGGKDLSNFEMVVKIQNLQKRLIRKTEQLLEMENQIEEKGMLLVQLEGLVKKSRPNVDLSVKCNRLQEKIRRLTNQMKTMSSEINMYLFLEKEQTYTGEKYQRELNEVKKEYYNIRKDRMVSKLTERARQQHIQQQQQQQQQQQMEHQQQQEEQEQYGDYENAYNENNILM